MIKQFLLQPCNNFILQMATKYPYLFYGEHSDAEKFSGDAENFSVAQGLSILPPIALVILAVVDWLPHHHVCMTL